MWSSPGAIRCSSATPAFDPLAQTPAKQAQQFGDNADYGYFCSLPAGSSSPHRGLLWVNHEYTNPELMFSPATIRPRRRVTRLTSSC